MVLKKHIQNWFSLTMLCHVLSFSIRIKWPPADCSTYVDESIKTLLHYYGRASSRVSSWRQVCIANSCQFWFANWVESILKVHNKSAKGGYEWAVGRIVLKLDVRNYVSELEHPGKSISKNSTRNCFCGAFFLMKKNPTEESCGKH